MLLPHHYVRHATKCCVTTLIMASKDTSTIFQFSRSVLRRGSLWGIFERARVERWEEGKALPSPTT